MWILDSAGGDIGGKRVWLRPGKRYLFGRVPHNGVWHSFSHGTVSRKHMVIEVSAVKPGDGSRAHAKSLITVIDENSKFGTIIDGELLKGGSKKLTGDEHSITLGKYEHALRIKWHPIVLSFSLPSKQLNKKDPLARVRSRLESLDIKTIIPYLIDKTTHVVQTKRNTAKGLQALINGKYIVQDSFIDALVSAATPSDSADVESFCPLEKDFDSAWPNAMEHLPPPVNEPVSRPMEAFKPDSARINVFEGHTFVFGQATQFEMLQAPINNGHGKALLYEVEEGSTSAEEIVQFMRNTAGQKGLGSQLERPTGVLFVRCNAKGEHEVWWTDLCDQVERKTGQRVVEQSQFLDAVLENDALRLCISLPQDATSSQGVEAGANSEAAVVLVEDSQQPLPSVAGLESSRQVQETQPRACNVSRKVAEFDDGFDMESIPVYSFDGPSQILHGETDTQVPEQTSSQHHTRSDEEDDVVSSLLPGASAMKRRRAEMGGHSQGESAPPAEMEDTRKPKRAKLDVLEAARRHREQEEEEANKRRREEETRLEMAFKDVDVEQMKNLAVVEDMKVPARDSRDDKTTREEGRWDDRWSGRKNFKKFRRKGDPNAPRSRIQAVIVPLEEVTRKDFGIGESYWVGNHNETSRGESRRASQRHSSSRQQISRDGTGESISQQSEVSASELRPSAEIEAAAPSSLESQSQKRARELRESDSEDELRFRFRRRR